MPPTFPIMRNPGPTSWRLLDAAGIRSQDELRALGAAMMPALDDSERP